LTDFDVLIHSVQITNSWVVLLWVSIGTVNACSPPLCPSASCFLFKTQIFYWLQVQSYSNNTSGETDKKKWLYAGGLAVILLVSCSHI